MMWYRILYWLKRGLYVVLAYVGLFLLVFTWQMIAAAVRNPDADSPTTMPLTTTLVGDLFADDKILSVAHAFQSATDWHLRRPNMEF